MSALGKDCTADVRQLSLKVGELDIQVASLESEAKEQPLQAAAPDLTGKFEEFRDSLDSRFNDLEIDYTNQITAARHETKSLENNLANNLKDLNFTA